MSGWCIREGGCDKTVEQCRGRCFAAKPEMVRTPSHHPDPRMRLELRDLPGYNTQDWRRGVPLTKRREPI